MVVVCSCGIVVVVIVGASRLGVCERTEVGLLV